ncbi:hypothetical protein Slin15195_G065130 [Septoria linicola]|uniref:Uncharacterized protein n=1 Tax=Septoria linicola TaxID=215465 RepID=A0A9Q9APQ9_9PEZI|nr:hypothetical protein Slin14017_G115470 [Septoria linicola]USW53194.1 hypothetical protein Slin15195_G065130 [Septoria linicola]
MFVMLREAGSGRGVAATHALVLALELLNLIAEPAEMVLWSHHLLEPWLYLMLQILKGLLWTTMAPISIWQLGKYFARPYLWEYWSLLAYFASMPLTFYLSLRYAIFVFVRSRKRTGYKFTTQKQPIA